MSWIPTAILWKIFYSRCLYVFIDCKNVFFSSELCYWCLGMEPVAHCVGLLCCLECPGRFWGCQFCTCTCTQNLQTFASELFTNSKTSCKKGKLHLEMDPRWLQRVKTSASWIAKSWTLEIKAENTPSHGTSSALDTEFSPGSQTPHLTQIGILGSAFWSDNTGAPTYCHEAGGEAPELCGSWWFPKQVVPNTDSK